jgi:hypothetical protein
MLLLMSGLRMGCGTGLRYAAIERVIADRLFCRMVASTFAEIRAHDASSPTWNRRMWAPSMEGCAFQRASAAAPLDMMGPAWGWAIPSISPSRLTHREKRRLLSRMSAFPRRAIRFYIRRVRLALIDSFSRDFKSKFAIARVSFLNSATATVQTALPAGARQLRSARRARAARRACW